MVLDNREILIERATKDLIGPFGLEEILFAKPSDNYDEDSLPKGTTIPDEQQDEDETNSGKDDGSDDWNAVLAGFVVLSPAQQAFLLRSNKQVQSVTRVDISFGKYARGAYCPFKDTAFVV